MTDTQERAAQLAEQFTARYDAAPDGVWIAPGRVNLIGEHTDYNEGFCLPFALDRGTYALVRRRDDDTVRAASSGPFDPVETTLGGLGPDSGLGWAAYPLGVLWALAQEGHAVPGVDILVDSDVPTGAGLSSSAALSCSVALAVDELADLGLDRTTLAGAARRAENEIAGAPTGPMDQLASMHGQRDAVVLIDCRTLDVRPVHLGLADAGLSLVVIDTRASHELVDGAYASRRRSCEEAAETLGVSALRDATIEDVEAAADRLGELNTRRARHVVTEDARVLQVVELLDAGRVAEIGPLLNASHVSMRDDFEISCAELDAAVEAAQGAGALGARMTGGGFGGSAVALVRDADVEAVTRAAQERFAAEGFREPHIFVVQPGPGARRLS